MRLLCLLLTTFTLYMIIPFTSHFDIYWSTSISRASTQPSIFSTSGALKLCHPKSRTRFLPSLYHLFGRPRTV